MDPWLASLLMVCVIAGTLGIAWQICLAKGIIARNDGPTIYLYPTKKEVNAQLHHDWNKQFGPPYHYPSIEDEHRAVEFIDEREIARRHQNFY